MPAGSTSTLRSLPILPSHLPCRLVCNPAFFAKRLAPLPRSNFSSASPPPQNVQGERNRPGSRENNYRPPNRPVVSASGRPCPSTSSGIPVLRADQNDVHPLAGADPVSDARDHRQHTHALRLRAHDAHHKTKTKCPSQRRRTLLWLMLTTRSPERAWAAYQELLLHRIMIPRHLLHQLARLLASIKPRTRTIHLQLLSVLKMVQRSGGQLRLWEWNTLIDSVGKQWHKTRLEDYENALDIFDKKGVLPITSPGPVDEALDAEAGSHVTLQNPDIWTYNILLSIAARSNLPHAVRHASSLLLSSGLSPNRYTHLCLLRYFAARKDLHNVRSTLRKMAQQGLEVGLDGINACLWAYARNGRFDVALRLYRVLRSHVEPMPYLGEHDVDEDARYVRDAIGLGVPDGLVPDAITYTMMIQALAYHGDLRNALGSFVDMLSAPHRGAGRQNSKTHTPTNYKPSMAAFRGLFLGFARHGRDAEHHIAGTEPTAALFPSSRASWDQDALETVFAAFLQLPNHPKPTERIMYWILVAFDKTSGSDAAKLREVWTKLEAKYGGGWSGRLEEIRKSVFASSDPKAS